MITLDSHVRFPRAKAAIRDEERRRKLFKAYSDAYQALHIRRPDRFTFDGCMMRIYIGKSMCESASEKRVEQQTKTMRNRLLDRE